MGEHEIKIGEKIIGKRNKRMTRLREIEVELTFIRCPLRVLTNAKK